MTSIYSEATAKCSSFVIAMLSTEVFLAFNTIVTPVIINASFVYISFIYLVYILSRSASSLAQTENMQAKN